jgi:hypothetical protein
MRASQIAGHAREDIIIQLKADSTRALKHQSTSRTILATPFTPTRLTATLAGAWSAIAMTTIEAWDRNGLVHVPDLVAALLGFFIPVALLVIGTKHLRLRGIRQMRKRARSAEYWVDMKQGWIRMVCWFVGAAVTGVALTVVIYGKWPIDR